MNKLKQPILNHTQLSPIAHINAPERHLRRSDVWQIADYKVIIFIKIIDYSNFLPLTAIFRCYLEDYYSAGSLPDYGLGTLVDKVNQDRQKIPNRRNDFGYADRAYIGKGIYI